MFLLTRKGLQVVYPSHPSRFEGFLEIMERGANVIGDDEPNEDIIMDIRHKVRGMLSDLMILYFMIRACRGEMQIVSLSPCVLERVYDNLRLALYISFRIYESVFNYYYLSTENDDDFLPLVPHHDHESDWLYDHYVMWRELMSESYGGDLMSLSVMRTNPLDGQDIACMCDSHSRLQRIMSDAQIDGTPVRHLLRPINYATAVWPTVRRMVALELRMRMNEKGEFGDTHIATWHHDGMYAIPPNAATILLAHRTGDHV